MMLKILRKSIGLILLTSGARALISPAEYPRKLEFGSPMMDDILEYCAENPELTRKLAMGEIFLGLWLTLR